LNFLTDDRLCRGCADLLAELPHGMFCRHGGTSKPPFSSLNLSFSVGDNPASVTANRQAVKQYLGLAHLVSAVQVHGDRVVLAENIQEDMEYPAADALITQQQGVGLLIQQADCQAVLFHDPVRHAVAAAHSGWKGSALNIISATVRMMQRHCGTNPADLRAVISPSLGPCCAEFVNWHTELPAFMHQHQVRENHFDFWAVSQEQLLAAGLQERNIECVGICTVCDSRFFSYRRAVKKQGRPGITGRCGSVIALPSA
jgi:polyphenol oxidase